MIIETEPGNSVKVRKFTYNYVILRYFTWFYVKHKLSTQNGHFLADFTKFSKNFVKFKNQFNVILKNTLKIKIYVILRKIR